ncbi:MAG: hypothetical protein H6737_01800 [Alphaproteobacteria bacterium]|nr:hypothetical protein [Alphaproteobacteria bacterium]
MRWLTILGAAALLYGAPARAQESKVLKAEKMIAKAEGGKPSMYLKAWDALAAAKESPETRDDPHVWVLVAQTAWRFVEDESLTSPVPEPWEVTLKAWDTAIGKGAADAYAEAVIEGLATMEAIESTHATNAYEGGRLDEAWVSLDRAARCQALIRQVGQVDPGRELGFVKLHLVVATELGKLDEARALHEALGKLGGRKAGTTLTLARAIAEREGVDAGLAFLKPFAEKVPDDAVMFETYADWLLEQKRDADLRALLEKNAEVVGKAPAITLVHAQLWTKLGDLAQANAAYEQALKVDGQNQEVLRGFADLALAIGRDHADQAAKEKAYKERKDLRSKRDEAFMKGMTLLQKSRELEPGHLPTLEKLHEVYMELEIDDPEEVAALESAIQDAKEAAKKPE